VIASEIGDALWITTLAAIGAGTHARDRLRRFVKVGRGAVAIDAIARIELRGDEVVLAERSGAEHVLDGFDAIEAVLLLAPQLLEGRRLRWRRHAWAIHNLIAHPAMQVAAWLGAPQLGIAIHDATVPRPLLALGLARSPTSASRRSRS